MLCLTLSPLSALSVCVPFLVYTLIPLHAFNPSQSDSQTLSLSLVDCIFLRLTQRRFPVKKMIGCNGGP